MYLILYLDRGYQRNHGLPVLNLNQVGPFQLNIQCTSEQVRLIGIDYSIVILIRWAHSDSIFNTGLDRLG